MRYELRIARLKVAITFIFTLWWKQASIITHLDLLLSTKKTTKKTLVCSHRLCENRRNFLNKKNLHKMAICATFHSLSSLVTHVGKTACVHVCKWACVDMYVSRHGDMLCALCSVRSAAGDRQHLCVCGSRAFTRSMGGLWGGSLSACLLSVPQHQPIKVAQPWQGLFECASIRLW